LYLEICSVECLYFSSSLTCAGPPPLLDPGIFSGTWLHLYTCFPMTPNHHRWCLEHSTCT
uniref:Uncharacterized protein n=1 Tax=Balaenoptera musculus TaxID=9771 RepID=A0A8C0CES8_BALMU